MTQELNIRLKTISHHFDSLNDGYTKAHFLAIKNEAEAIVRFCTKELGGYNNHIQTSISYSPPTPEVNLKCRFCNLEFTTERGILAHESVKHRELWKQTR